MTAAQAALLTSTIFLFFIGAWPIAVITAIGFIAIAIIRVSKEDQSKNSLSEELEQLKEENWKLQKEIQNNENQKLKAEVEKLRAELADQTVRQAMEQAEKREKKG